MFLPMPIHGNIPPQCLQEIADRGNILRRITDLLAWFDRNRESYPWRNNPSPYGVWISEIMLQQTMIAAVTPHFERWMRLFPDIPSLAAAGEREVLRVWEGLGYYQRARNALKAAALIVRRHGGQVPETYESLIELPGIGDYTASAVLSIAFGKPYPVIDANVRRIGRRFLAWRSWDRERERTLRLLLTEIVSSHPPGIFNESLMELGQKICLRSQPLCTACPLRASCLARRKGLQRIIPEPGRTLTVRKETILFILVNEIGVFLTPRKDLLLQGLWVFPGTPAVRDRDLPAGDPASGIPAGWRFLGRLPARIHHYTRFRERLDPWVFETDRPPSETGGRWISLDEIGEFPLPSIYRRIVEDLERFLSDQKTGTRLAAAGETAINKIPQGGHP